MDLFVLIVCKAIIAALALFVIAIIVGAWLAFIKSENDILILKLIIFFGLVAVSLLAVLFVVMACIPLLIGTITI